MVERVIAAVKRVATQEIMPRFLKVAHQRKSDGSLFTEADLAAQEALSIALKDIHPGPMVGEEMTEEQHVERWLAGDAGLWCVDPIDGTSNFVYGLPYFAVSVALIQQGRSVLGVVYDPVADEVFYAERGRGAYLNGERLPIRSQIPHIRNAMARWNQTEFQSATAKERARQKIVGAARRHGIEVSRDSQVAKPSRSRRKS